MGSDAVARLPLKRLAVILLAACLAGCALLAEHWQAFPRALTIIGLVALMFVRLLWKIPDTRVLREEYRSRMDSGPDPPEIERQLQAAEAHIEHAPVALFRIQAGVVAPLNSRARRVIAPGRATNPRALLESLAAEPCRAPRLISFDTEQGVERALAFCSSITIEQQAERIVALMSVESELETATLRAWQQLVHVLTHEIANSLTAVASLSRTARQLVQDTASRLPADIYEDLSVSLAAISGRSGGLIDFIFSYRSLSSVPEPQAERIRLCDLLARLTSLTAPVWRGRGGECTYSVSPRSLELIADPGQLEQALLNLMVNAFEATDTTPAAKLHTRAFLARGGRLCIEVADNGPGIPEELIPQIFTPFFSTKARSRGIGLALVRQLVHGNRGTVRYAKSVSGGARFVLIF